MWKKCCFSGDGEYVCAGSARQHALYVWEKSIGNLVKILHGTKGELLLDVVVRKFVFIIKYNYKSLSKQE
jgi:COMPASS component SWD1